VQQVKATSSSRGEFAWHLGADTGAIADARQAFERWLLGMGVGEADVEDLTVVLSELASNAATGAGPDGASEITARVVGDDVHLQVTNPVGDGTDDLARWDLDDPLRGGGRGLLIVRAYTDSMEVVSRDGAITVRCVRGLDLGR
jgi:anti-sigma regulatory factor (Ser/Thr protein kinase)